jgi:hypothetical protein
VVEREEIELPAGHVQRRLVVFACLQRADRDFEEVVTKGKGVPAGVERDPGGEADADSEPSGPQQVS